MKTGTVLLGNCSTYGRNLRVKSSSAAGRGLAKNCRWGLRGCEPIGAVKTLKQYQNSPAEFDSVVELKKSQVKTTAWEDNKGPEGYSTVRSVMIKAYPDFGYSYRQFKGSNKLWASDRSGAFTRKTVFNYDYNK